MVEIVATQAEMPVQKARAGGSGGGLLAPAARQGIGGEQVQGVPGAGVAHHTEAGAQLLDTQFVTPHLATLGAVEIPREDYHRRLDVALGCAADFYVWPKEETISGAQALKALA
jgi:hypothetical protein